MKKNYALKSYFKFLARYKWKALFVGIVFALSDTALTVVPIFIGRLVGAATAGNTQDIWRNVVALVVCSSLHDMLWRASELSYLKLLLPVPFQYENGIFHEVISKPYPYFVGKFTGKIASYVSGLRKEFEDLLDVIFWEYISFVVGSVGIVAILFSLNIYTGVVFVVGCVLMTVAGKYAIPNSLKAEGTYADINSTKNGKIIDIIGNFVNVKSFGKEHAEYSMLKREQLSVLESRKKLYLWTIWFWAVMSFFVRELMWPITIVLNAWLFTRGVINVAQLATLLSTILIFSQRIWQIVWQISQFSLRAARAEEAHRYLFGKRVVTISEPEQPEPAIVHFQKEMRIKELNFSYPDQKDHTILHDISLTIKKGEKIGIVGRSGSGKTTFVKLLLGYYDHYNGVVLVDGKTVASRDLLSIIAYVPQDTSLFNRTIAENIAYAVGGKVSRKKLIEVSKHALADEFISKITDNYDAVVGERGVKLSTGQRQRIAIARAMLQDKPLLILDEATSALDSENEALVQQSLENLWDDRTVISIAHRLSTLKKMDRIVVFDAGRIVEEGSMSDLLKQKGRFYELWNHQVNGMILE